MTFFQLVFTIFGRILLSLVFLVSGINTLLNWNRFEDVLVATLCDWHVAIRENPILIELFGAMLNWVPLVLGGSLVMELLGAVLLFLGFKPRFGALLLLLFLCFETLLYHPFWIVMEPRKETEFLYLLANVAIMGGLFLVMAQSPAKVFKKKQEQLT